MLNKLRLSRGNASRDSLLQVRSGFEENKVRDAWGVSAQEFLVSQVLIDLGITFDTLISHILLRRTRFESQYKPLHELFVHDTLHSVAVCLILRSFAHDIRSSFHGNVLVHCNTLSNLGLTVNDVGQVPES